MRQYTKAERIKWVAEWKRSGKSAQLFSEGKPFSASTITYWKRKTGKSKQSTSSFIEVISKQEKSTSKYSLIFPSGIIMEMDQLPPIEELKALVNC